MQSLLSWWVEGVSVSCPQTLRRLASNSSRPGRTSASPSGSGLRTFFFFFSFRFREGKETQEEERLQPNNTGGAWRGLTTRLRPQRLRANMPPCPSSAATALAPWSFRPHSTTLSLATPPSSSPKPRPTTVLHRNKAGNRTATAPEVLLGPVEPWAAVPIPVLALLITPDERSPRSWSSSASQIHRRPPDKSLSPGEAEKPRTPRVPFFCTIRPEPAEGLTNCECARPNHNLSSTGMMV